MSTKITIDFENPDHQAKLTRAIADPGTFVPRADHYGEAMHYWQLRAINEAFSPSPMLYIWGLNRSTATAFAHQNSLGQERRHWRYLSRPDDLRGVFSIRLIRMPGWDGHRDREAIEEYLQRVQVEELG